MWDILVEDVALEIVHCIDLSDYTAEDIDDLGDDLMALEDEVWKKVKVLSECDERWSDFNWYDFELREKLCEAVMKYEGCDFAMLSDIFIHKDKTIYTLFKLAFDTACDDIIKEIEEAE
jgi:hypothetical protein